MSVYELAVIIDHTQTSSVSRNSVIIDHTQMTQTHSYGPHADINSQF